MMMKIYLPEQLTAHSLKLPSTRGYFEFFIENGSISNDQNHQKGAVKEKREKVKNRGHRFSGEIGTDIYISKEIQKSSALWPEMANGFVLWAMMVLRVAFCHLAVTQAFGTHSRQSITNSNHRTKLPDCKRKFQTLSFDAPYERRPIVLFASDKNDLDDQALSVFEGGDDEPTIIVRGSDEDDLDDSVWEDAEAGQPGQWQVMQQVCT